MKLKLTWPAGIIIALTAFIIFILSFVFKVTFLDEYHHHLVSEQYYKDELNYQQEIDEVNRGLALEQNIKLSKTANGLNVIFPKEFDYKNIEGTIYFQRTSNNKIDFKIPIDLTSHTYLISNEKLLEGRWNVKINWKANNTNYLYKEKLTY
ncbi:MAG TPA: FixH family protein [Flavobacteriaceae bacterium]|nr:FixH family protein [Flavobacteriaceae bacterium]